MTPARQHLRTAARTTVLPSLLLLAACAAPGTPGSGTTSVDDLAPVLLTDAREAVGTWTVGSTPPGAEAGAVVQISDLMTLWLDCGTVDVSYLLGTDGTLLTDAWSGSGACDLPGPPAWLADATSVASVGDDLVLRATDGTVVATLTPGGTPEVPDQVSPELAADPVLDDALRTALDPASPALPAGLTAATASELTGRWLPAVPVGDPTASYLLLEEGGRWSGSDGCNGVQGLWLARAGSWRATAGPQTLIGCEGVRIPALVTVARAAGLDSDGALVLLDADGAELVRLVAQP